MNMQSFKNFFYRRYKILNEYFVDNAWPYYIDKEGKIHDVDDGGHLATIETDYNLFDLIPDDVIPQDLDDYDRWVDWMMTWMKKNQVYAIVYDIVNKIVYVRCGSRDLNDAQRESIIDFCIAKKSELVYDMKAIA